MNQPTPLNNPTTPDFGTQFSMRPASQAWDQFAFADGSQRFVWVWFKPGYAPQGLVVRVPDESWKVELPFAPMTLRGLLQAAGISSRRV